MALPDAPLLIGPLVLALGGVSGLALTLMDRIDEHRVIERQRTQWAYLAGIGTAAAMAGSIQLVPVLYPFLFALWVEWIVKNKVDFPSHVFSLLLLALYLGARLDLLQAYCPHVLFFLGIRYVSGSLLRRRIERGSALARRYYAAYWEKFACAVLLAWVLSSGLLLVYALSFTAANFYTKKWLPERAAAPAGKVGAGGTASMPPRRASAACSEK